MDSPARPLPPDPACTPTSAPTPVPVPAPAPDADALVRLQQENARLAERVRVLEWTFEHFSQGVLAMSADGRVEAWNERVVDLLEVPRALLAGGATVRELIVWQVENGVFSAVAEPQQQAWLQQGVRYLQGLDARRWTFAPYQRERRDGRIVEVITHQFADGAQVRTFSDVTERERAQRALARSEARFRAMADAAPAFIWESDARGQAVWLNQRWLQAIGRTLEQALQEPWVQRLHPEAAGFAQEPWDELVRQGLPFEIEVRVRTADGRELWLADHGIPQHDAGGRFRGYLVYGWEITARKAAERNLIAARDEAERANRAKSEFLSRMSHELRTPLNAVQGFAQLIEGQAEANGDAVLAERAQYIQRGGRHLLALINDVLDLARIEAGALPLQLQVMALEPTLAHARHLLEPLARARHVQLWRPQPLAPQQAPTLVRADPTRLRQVLLNLLANAIKYNRRGGQVRVDLRVDGSASPGQVRLEVTDTGPGLAPAQCARLFQAFERLDAEHDATEGAGIGLALTKVLVEAMQGRIGVTSRIGQGSTFWVELPRVESERVAVRAQAAVLDPDPVLPARADGRPWRVLYVEDNPVNQLLMEGMLARLPGLELRLVAAPGAALVLVREWLPDLLLLDVQLPEMNGCELLQRLRADARLAAVPAAAVSANAMADDLRQASAAGFERYLTKPLQLHELLAVVSALLQAGRGA